MAQGRVPYHEHDDRDVREALAAALGERKIRLNDRRLLVIYLFIVASVAVTFLLLSNAQHKSDRDRRHFEHLAVVNCEANRLNSTNFNEFIDTLEDTYRKSPVLSQKEITERILFFERAKGVVPTCPPD